MKTCTLCKQSKPESEFNKNARRKDGFQNKCKECSRQYSKSHYNDNHAYYIRKNKRNRDRVRAWLLEYKQHLKCNRCGEDRLPCLEFHHKNPNEKDFCVSVMVRGYSIERLEREIAKCEVLCRNCHAIEHWHVDLD